MKDNFEYEDKITHINYLIQLTNIKDSEFIIKVTDKESKECFQKNMTIDAIKNLNNCFQRYSNVKEFINIIKESVKENKIIFTSIEENNIILRFELKNNNQINIPITIPKLIINNEDILNNNLKIIIEDLYKNIQNSFEKQAEFFKNEIKSKYEELKNDLESIKNINKKENAPNKAILVNEKENINANKSLFVEVNKNIKEGFEKQKESFNKEIKERIDDLKNEFNTKKAKDEKAMNNNIEKIQKNLIKSEDIKNIINPQIEKISKNINEGFHKQAEIFKEELKIKTEFLSKTFKEKENQSIIPKNSKDNNNKEKIKKEDSKLLINPQIKDLKENIKNTNNPQLNSLNKEIKEEVNDDNQEIKNKIFTEIQNMNKAINSFKEQINTNNNKVSEFHNKINSLEKLINDKVPTKKFTNQKIKQVASYSILPLSENINANPINQMVKYNSQAKDLIFHEDLISNSYRSWYSSFDIFQNSNKDIILAYLIREKNSIAFYNINKKKIEHIIENAHLSQIYTIRYFQDTLRKRDLFVTSSLDKTTKIWNYSDNYNVVISINHGSSKAINSSFLMKSEKDNNIYAVNCSFENNICVYDLAGKFVKDFGIDSKNTQYADGYQDEKGDFIIQCNDKGVSAYNLNIGRLYKTYFNQNQGCSHGFAINTINNIVTLILSDYNSGLIRLFNFHTGVSIKAIKSEGSDIQLNGLCLWNAQYLFAAGDNNQLKLFDIFSGVYLKGFDGHTSRITVIKKFIHPELGECLLTQGADNKIKIWKVNK